MKLTTERLKKLIKEELNKMNEGLGISKYEIEKMNKFMSTTPDEEEEKAMMDKARYERGNADFQKKKEAETIAKQQEIISSLRSMNLIANYGKSVEEINVKLKDPNTGKTTIERYTIYAGLDSILDDIKQKYPNAMMQASKRGMRHGDFVDVQDPTMEQ